MDAKSFATQMKGEIQDLKDQGVAAVFIDNLIAYLDRVENVPSAEPTPLEVEQYKAVLAQNLQAMLQNHNSDLEMFKSVITAAQNATRAMTAINGGAAVAMLAFLGHLAAIRSPVIPAYAGCMVPFVIGTIGRPCVSFHVPDAILLCLRQQGISAARGSRACCNYFPRHRLIYRLWLWSLANIRHLRHVAAASAATTVVKQG